MEIPFFKNEQQIPKILGPLIYSETTTFEDSRLGFQIRFRDRDFDRSYRTCKLDAFIYDFGHEKVFDRVYSSYYMSFVENDFENIFEQNGKYEDFEFDGFWCSGELKEYIGRIAWVGSYSFSRVIDERVKVNFKSYYLLTEFEGKFVKLRTTLASDSEDIYNVATLTISFFKALEATLALSDKDNPES